jgi:hypothetical protein
MKLKHNCIIVAGLILISTLSSAVMATSDGYSDSRKPSAEKIHEQMHQMLDKLAARLEIKASQQGAWEEFSKSIEFLPEQHINNPSDEADAASIAKYRADRAADFAKKLAKIADATAKLQAVLSDDQRKILNQVSREFLHKKHDWNNKAHHHESESRN